MRTLKIKRWIKMKYVLSLLLPALSLLITPPVWAQSTPLLIFFDNDENFDQQFQQTLEDLLLKYGKGFKYQSLARGEEETKQIMGYCENRGCEVREEDFPIVLVLTKDEEQVEKRLPQERSEDGDNAACDALYQITGKLIERTNPKDGAVMIYIPKGEFLMGSDKSKDSQADGSELPQRKVYLDGYWIYKHEVTVAQYRKFCNETKRQMPEEPSWGWQDDHPIVDVIYDNAVAYCNWAGVQLPTEAQWEKAARGTDGRIWPWGNEAPDAGGRYRANYNPGNYTEDSYRYTAPVGSFPLGASPYGLMDMAGNVWEWCADWYDANYYASAPAQNPPGPSSGTWRVLRGGSWYGTPYYLRAADRAKNYPVVRSDVGGFRGVALRLPPQELTGKPESALKPETQEQTTEKEAEVQQEQPKTQEQPSTQEAAPSQTQEPTGKLESAPKPETQELIDKQEQTVKKEAEVQQEQPKITLPANLTELRDFRSVSEPTQGTIARNLIDDAEMVYIPEGEFLMGSDKNKDSQAHNDELPQRKVYLDGYWIYKHEVTVAQYRKFCNETGRQMPSAPSWGWQDNHPIVYVTYYDAVAYCNWAKVQLPTEAQWEKAARGTDGRIWPWGNEAPDAGGRYRANYDPGNYTEDGYRYTAPVGSFPLGASPYGLLDMAGNVWEWCADWYDANYYASAPAQNPPGPSSGTMRVLRGGSWYSRADVVRAADRVRNGPGDWYYDFGFRGVALRFPRLQEPIDKLESAPKPEMQELINKQEQIKSPMIGPKKGTSRNKAFALSLGLPGFGQHIQGRHLRGGIYEAAIIGAGIATLWSRSYHQKTLDDYLDVQSRLRTEAPNRTELTPGIRALLAKQEDAYSKAKFARTLAIGTQIALGVAWGINALDAYAVNPAQQRSGITIEMRPISDGGRILVSMKF